MSSRKVRVGDLVTPRELSTLASGTIRLPEPDSVVHLQFRRYAGCPICTLHLRSFARRSGEITAAGVREVVVFHSRREALAQHQAELPFAVVPDPTKVLYRAFAVERSLHAVLHPRSWVAAVRGWSPTLGLRADTGGHLGLPADFLVAPNGRVLAVKYGTYATDQWSVDDLFALVRP